MNCPDRVALVGLCWFALGTSLGIAVGSTLFGQPRTGAVYGFFLAFATCLLWPLFLPNCVGDWMDDSA